ncbi:MAG: helix-turn-helix transcriptional regulator [Gammaproteobacteria bacterium]|nr:helix-turn-helix transcriptional regulator [Gammaproteobacteria bacterium]
MGNYKEWYSARELVGVGGLPSSPQGVNKKARTQGWVKRNKEGVQGGAVEYHVHSMPSNVQMALGVDDVRIKPATIEDLSNDPENPPKLTNIGLVSLPLYKDVYASAGFGAENTDDGLIEEIMLSSVFLDGLNKKNLIAIYTKGDSMSPIINSGDIIIVDTAINRPEDGKTFVIRVGQELFVKRLQRDINGLKLISENQQYSEMLLPYAELENASIIGRVVRSVCWL